MTDYVDVPTVSALHGEAERTQQAIDMLASGGTMSNFTVAPPPPDPSGVPSPMMMSVNIQVTEPLSAELLTALNDWLTARLAKIVDELATYDIGPPPPPVTDPPVNVTVPYCEQSGPNLTCTMGNWDNMQQDPHSYAYTWKKEDGTMVGTNAPTYAVAFADVGVTFTCTVSATNKIGTTEGPPSNSVTVVAPA